jgi:hypothetical protein
MINGAEKRLALTPLALITGGRVKTNFLLVSGRYAYDPHNLSWAAIASLPGPVYQHAVVAAMPALIISLGGCGSDGGTIQCPSNAGFALSSEPDEDGDGVPDFEDLSTDPNS